MVFGSSMKLGVFRKPNSRTQIRSSFTARNIHLAFLSMQTCHGILSMCIVCGSGALYMPLYCIQHKPHPCKKALTRCLSQKTVLISLKDAKNTRWPCILPLKAMSLPRLQKVGDEGSSPNGARGCLQCWRALHPYPLDFTSRVCLHSCGLSHSLTKKIFKRSSELLLHTYKSAPCLPLFKLSTGDSLKLVVLS